MNYKGLSTYKIVTIIRSSVWIWIMTPEKDTYMNIFIVRFMRCVQSDKYEVENVCRDEEKREKWKGFSFQGILKATHFNIEISQWKKSIEQDEAFPSGKIENEKPQNSFKSIKILVNAYTIAFDRFQWLLFVGLFSFFIRHRWCTNSGSFDTTTVSRERERCAQSIGVVSLTQQLNELRH